MKKIILIMIGLCLSNAWAEIGSDVASILDPLEDFNITKIEGGYKSEGGTLFAFEERNDKVYRVYGDGVLDETGISFIAELLAQTTGYGKEIQEPLIDFFKGPVENLIGQGIVSLPVEQYSLELEIKEEKPYDIAFALKLSEVPSELFPPAKHSKGPADAKYVIREFSDLQCPHCSSFAAKAVPLIEEELLPRGDVRFEFHHFPLVSIHDNAMLAAEASECVTETNNKEAFWIYHNALFERQRAWSNLEEPNAYFIQLAKDLDFKTKDIKECLENRDFAEELLEAYKAASEELSLSGTPSVFINSYKLGDYTKLDSYLELFELIDSFSAETE